MQILDLSFRRGPTRRCRVRAGPGVLDLLIEDLAADPPGRLLVVISDSNVAPLHAAPFVSRLEGRGLATELVSFPAGEASKTRETKARLEDRLFEIGAGRDCALVALGGGVTGDLAGFVAATWNRGVPVVQVPASLLSMVDAALGGKTAVNLRGGKNLVGAFHQPWGVYADVSLLSTLPEADFRDGFAEVVKSAAIADLKLFRWLETAAERLVQRDEEALSHAVASCLAIKGRVVARDEREVGRRAMLNFGHTIAHALEAVTRYTLSHGQAVSIGMTLEAQLATRATGFPPAHARRLRSLLEAFGLPTAFPVDLAPEAVIRTTRADKKSRGGEIRCALPLRLGRMPAGEDVTVAVDEDLLGEALSGR